MAKDLTKIVLNTAGLHKDTLGAPEEVGPAINYGKLEIEQGMSNSGYYVSVFLLDRENVSSVTENGDKLEVLLAEGIEPVMVNGALFIKTYSPIKVTIPVPFGLGRFFDSKKWAEDNGSKVRIPIPGSRREDYCTDLGYLDSIQRGDTVLYQRK